MSENQLTTIISTVALMIAVFSFVVSALTYKRDRSKLKLTFMEKGRIVHARPPYESNTDYTTVTATNVGRRPCTITHMGHTKLWDFGTDAIWGDAMGKNPRTLEEGGFVAYLAEYDTVMKKDWPHIAYFFVIDSTGKETRTRVSSLPQYVVFVVLQWFYKHRPFKKPAQKT